MGLKLSTWVNLGQPGNSADTSYLGTTAGLGAPDEQYTNWKCTEIPDVDVSYEFTVTQFKPFETYMNTAFGQAAGKVDKTINIIS